jgi:hypothetical protein
MNAEDCPRTAAVVESARSGRWDERSRAHVDECPACTESARVAAWMTRVAAELGREPLALDPTFIWLKAEVARRAERASRASRRALRAGAIASLTVGLAGAAAALAVWPKVAAAANAAHEWLLALWVGASLSDLTIIGTGWLELPLLLGAIYVLVLRPSR